MAFNLMLPGGYMNYSDDTDFTLLEGGTLRVMTDEGEHLIGPSGWLAVVDTKDPRAPKWELLTSGD